MNTPLEELQLFLSYLYIQHPFYNSIISNIDIYLDTTKESKKFKIYSPKFKSIVIDEQFAKDLLKKDKKILFYYLFHEILHMLLNHKNRSINKIENKWNRATDIAVDEVIKKDTVLRNILMLPKEYEGISEIYDTSNGVSFSAEDIYDKLNNTKKEESNECENGESDKSEPNDGESDKEEPNESEKSEPNDSKSEENPNDSKSQNGEHLDNHNSWGEQNKEEDSEEDIENEINEMILKASEFEKIQEKDFGGTPGVFQEKIDQLLSPKTNIKKHLNKIIQSFKNYKSNYSRGDNRYLHNGLIVPSRVKSVKHFKLLFYIDTSGSMDISGLKQSLSEIIDMLNTLKSYEVEIIQSDVGINKVISITDKDNLDMDELLTINGRGGTELTPLFDYIKEDENKFDAIIVNTDFYIQHDEFLTYLDLENEYNFLALIPDSHDEKYAKQLSQAFYLNA